ncbi:MAG: M42 family metallopeptidase [Massiliimalia sp.]
MNQQEYMLHQVKTVLSIDSPSGYTQNAAQYVWEEYRRLGYDPMYTRKGGVLVCVNPGDGTQPDDGVLLEAHLDTLGAMVAQVKDNGRLRLTPLGGMNPNNGEAENVRIITRSGKTYTGTFQLKNASIHVNGEYNGEKRTFDSGEVVIDELVQSKEDVEALGIQTGDIVCFDPRTVVTESGYIKSRFLDDKLSVGILLGYARYLSQSQQKPSRKIYHHITVFEEVGHGGSGSVPSDVGEIISVDMGCVGDGLACQEHMVSICAKDSGGPYHYDVVSRLIEAAKKAGVEYAVDVYPFYGSDAEAGLRAGYDVKHGLIGAGVYASHGYERSHVKGMNATYELLKAYFE